MIPSRLFKSWAIPRSSLSAIASVAKRARIGAAGAAGRGTSAWGSAVVIVCDDDEAALPGRPSSSHIGGFAADPERLAEREPWRSYGRRYRRLALSARTARLPKSVTYVVPRRLGLTSAVAPPSARPIPTSVNCDESRLARCGGDFIHACTVARAVDSSPVPQAMFSPMLQPVTRSEIARALDARHQRRAARRHVVEELLVGHLPGEVGRDLVQGRVGAQRTQPARRALCVHQAQRRRLRLIAVSLVGRESALAQRLLAAFARAPTFVAAPATVGMATAARPRSRRACVTTRRHAVGTL